ncbi:MAG: nucleotidyltransferase family protein [Anderseniella sp.]
MQKSSLLSTVLRSWDDLQLQDCWLVAGSVAQTVWNSRFDLPHDFGISDLDLVYFDPDDLSVEAEQAHAKRIRDRFKDLPVWFDVKNEARVHLWYEDKFGYSIDQYQSVEAAISTFPTTATAVGIRLTTDELEVHSPFGLDDLMEGIIRPNKAQITKDIYDAKVKRWIKAWPKLVTVEWDDG